jgi:hypothetical protein
VRFKRRSAWRFIDFAEIGRDIFWSRSVELSHKPTFRYLAEASPENGNQDSAYNKQRTLRPVLASDTNPAEPSDALVR